MPVSHRIEQINELLQHEISKLLLTEVDFPRNCLVTITMVDTSKDLRHATIWISVLPGMYSGKALEAIKKNVGQLQHALNKRLSMRPLPRILFKVDDTERKAAVIEHAINKLDRIQDLDQPIE